MTARMKLVALFLMIAVSAAGGMTPAQVIDGVGVALPKAPTGPGDFDFDPPPDFSTTLPLNGSYINQGTSAIFIPLDPGHGNGAILNYVEGGFGVTGLSEPNALCYNSAATNLDDSIPALPAIIYLPRPVWQFTCKVASNASAGSSLLLAGLDQFGGVVDVDVTTLASAAQITSVSGSGIQIILIAGDVTVLCVDDIFFSRE